MKKMTGTLNPLACILLLTISAPRAGRAAADHDHDHEETSALDRPLSDIAAARCEHAIETYQCDECRYEVGVVKLDPTLLKNGTNGRGLMRTADAGVRSVAATIEGTGEIRLNGNAAVHITPRVAGVIDTVAVDLGSQVAPGDLLFTLDSAELGRALTEYRRNRALTELSEKTYRRELDLFEKRIGSEQDAIDARMAYETHRTELVASEQALHNLGLTEADIAAAGEAHGMRLGLLPTRSPIEGTVLERHAVKGELVAPGDDVMLVAALGTLWAWIDVYEQDLARLAEAAATGGVPVTVSVRAFPDRVFQGTIDYVGATMDEKTRTVKARATVANPDGLLRPGMFCRAAIAVTDGERALTVPNGAVLSDEGRDFVFTHWKDDYFVQRPVRVGRRVGDVAEILNGLAPGDRVVAEGAFLMKSDVLREKMGAGCAD